MTTLASLLLAGATVLAPLSLHAQDNRLPAELRQRAESAISKGVEYLLGAQKPNGSWADHPAITSLAATAVACSPSGATGKEAVAVDRALGFVIANAREDGSIWNQQDGEYPNYSTAISLIALAVVNRPQDLPVIRAARRFLLDSQFAEVPSNDASYGGVGYGKKLRPDLSNTQWALEALYLTDHLDREPFSTNPNDAKKADLAWEKARAFLARCQNLATVNDQAWVASDPENRGGFVYMPGESKAGTDQDGERETLRSYGSMTYAGLKSMIYAEVDATDERVTAAVEWLARNFTFDENPGMGEAGLYYYFHTCAKALDAYGHERIRDAKGVEHAWRAELAEKLVGLQKEDGSWANANGRWWESMPELSSCYSLLSLEIVRGRAWRPNVSR